MKRKAKVIICGMSSRSVVCVLLIVSRLPYTYCVKIRAQYLTRDEIRPLSCIYRLVFTFIILSKEKPHLKTKINYSSNAYIINGIDI